MEMMIFVLLRIWLVSLVLASDCSSGLGSFPPFPSPLSPLPEIGKEFAPVPSDPVESPESGNTPSPVVSQRSLPPSPAPSDIRPNVSSSPSPSVTEAPAASPVTDLPPKNSPVIQPSIPIASPPLVVPGNAPKEPPVSDTVPDAPDSTPMVNSPPSPPLAIPPGATPRNSSNNHGTPVASPPKIPKGTPPSIPPVMPSLTPSSSNVPIRSPTSGSPESPPGINPVLPRVSPLPSPDHAAAPVKNPRSTNSGKDNRSPVAAPPAEVSKPLPSFDRSHDKGSPSVAPSTPRLKKHSHHNAPLISSPNSLPSRKDHPSPALSPFPSFHRHQQKRKRTGIPAPAPSHLIPPQRSEHKESEIPSSNDYGPSPLVPGSLVSPSKSPVSSSMNHVSPAPSPSPTQVFPFRSSSKPPKNPPLKAFPPPPPNADCSSTVCMEPYTNTPPGSACGCVWPMQVALRLSVALYTFFPSVSKFAQEIATGVFMKQSQVRIMGANAASEQPEKSIVLVDLVPLGEKFDNTTALLTYQRFWSKKVSIDASLFGNYEVLYVRYPGLPSSPPFPHSGMTIIDGVPYSGNGRNGGMIKPFGVDVPKKRHKKGLNGGTIAVVVLSASTFVGLCFAVVWVLLFKQRDEPSKAGPLARPSLPSLSKPSGSTRSINGSHLSSASLSFESSIAPFTLSAKTFTASEIGRATNDFDESRVLGEGGFGRVYSGVLEDSTKVAVKVLKRDDQQGSREFLAEVEMLSRLHHRNLVNLIGICIEERNRCLVYELIPNGSVDSHLHGVDKESSPLDWDARLKIALGAARGLAYLHEDSSPRVIHRDFKSSNILLEHDFTPKVSDFGLARTAMDEENRHISTRVMGTFGYVAPEYAMTGHLLVKSDVYSYGVVLLELLTGRKPVDMSQPPGQENLVAWTRPLLTSREGLEAIIDPSLGPEFPFDSVAKVAAIASMCVQPEVSHRPFMGEVVQALKLVCNECDEAKELASVTSTTQEDLSFNTTGDYPTRNNSTGGSGRLALLPNYDSEPDTERGLSVSEMLGASGRSERQTSTGSLRRYSSSGPLTTGRGKKFWRRIRRLSGGSMSEHGTSIMSWPGSH